MTYRPLATLWSLVAPLAVFTPISLMVGGLVVARLRISALDPCRGPSCAAAWLDVVVLVSGEATLTSTSGTGHYGLAALQPLAGILRDPVRLPSTTSRSSLSCPLGLPVRGYPVECFARFPRSKTGKPESFTWVSNQGNI